MRQPTPDELRSAASVTKSHPKFIKWLTGWKDHELSTLPMTLMNTGVAQGRCQILQELSKFLEEAPDL